jgi:hypothetical protein
LTGEAWAAAAALVGLVQSGHHAQLLLLLPCRCYWNVPLVAVLPAALLHHALQLLVLLLLLALSAAPTIHCLPQKQQH